MKKHTEVKMSNDKQSSVDIFKEQLIDIFEDYHDGIITLDEYIENINKATEQAKEMEKERMFDFALLHTARMKYAIQHDNKYFANQTFELWVKGHNKMSEEKTESFIEARDFYDNLHEQNALSKYLMKKMKKINRDKNEQQ